MECPKCSSSLPTNCQEGGFVVCGGSCLKSFHAACVGVCEAIARCHLKNVIWLCDDCLDVFNNQVSRQMQSDCSSVNIEVEIIDMKEKLVSITDSLSTLISKQVPTVARVSQEDTFNSIQRPTHQSTPLSKLNCGSRMNASTTTNNTHSSSNANSLILDRSNDFSLFLSNIDCTVSQQEATRMVIESLGINEVTEKIEIVKLVPKWNVHNYSQYTSYKVVIDGKYKQKALETNTWPVDVMFREFFNYPRRTWKPTEIRNVN